MGVTIVCAKNFPPGLVPAAFAQGTENHIAMLEETSKDTGLSVIGVRTFVAETPEHSLDDVTNSSEKSLCAPSDRLDTRRMIAERHCHVFCL